MHAAGPFGSAAPAGLFGSEQQQGRSAAAHGAGRSMDHIFPSGFTVATPVQLAAALQFRTIFQSPGPTKWETVIRKTWQLSADPKACLRLDLSLSPPDWLTVSTATSVELVTQPAAVAFLLTDDMGLAHVRWKRRECPTLSTVITYALRLQ